MNRFYTTGQVAQYCGVNFRTVIRWIERGLLQAHKLPGRGDHRVGDQDLLQFIRNQGMPVPQELETNNKVLIVDDEEVSGKSIEKILEKAGYECSRVKDGFIAGIALKELRPAVMTLDLMMPGLNGFEVIQYIRQQEEFQPLKILVISGAEQNELDRAKIEGADDAIAKPIDTHQLLDSIENMIKEEVK